MANAKISDNSIFIPKTNVLDVVGLAGYDASGNVKISGSSLKSSILTGAIRTITATSPLERTDGGSTTISIKKASKTQDGYLSSSDFTTFSDADGSVKSVSGTGTVSGINLSGTVTDTGNLTLGGTLSLTSANVTNGLGFTPYNGTNPDNFTDNTGTVISVTTTAPLSGSITSSGSLSITKADTNTDGYLTKDNWNTFNSKSTFDGDYTNLTNKPTIPTNNDELTNGQEFITSASLPTVNDGKFTITLNGTATEFTANQSGDTNLSITTGTGENYYVTGASYSGETLTLTRNGSLADVTADGFLQVGTNASDALAGNTTTITTGQATEIGDNTLKTSFPGFGVTNSTALRGDTVIPPTAPVDSVNTKTGVVVLDTDDISEGSSNLYYTEARVAANSDVADNTAKVGITSGQATEISDNTLKVGITTGQATEISDNTAKTGITSGQATEISDNSAKVGITTGQASAISANTLKKSMVIGTASDEALAGNTSLFNGDYTSLSNKPTTITGAQANAINTNSDKVSMVIGTASNEALAGNTSLLQIGDTSTTALKGNTVIPVIDGFSGTLNIVEDRQERATEIVVADGLITEVNRPG